jgi:maleylpyruvate isomerase
MAREYDIPKLTAKTRESHARLDRTLSTLDEDAIRKRSMLPGWSRAHVLAHLARNAEALSRMMTAAINGEVADQYPGGAEARNADIEETAKAAVAELVEDVRKTARTLDETAEQVPPDAWQRPVRFLAIGEQPAARTIWLRWREVEIHHSDLGLVYNPSDWPDEFLTEYLPGELRRLPGRLPAGLSVVMRVDRYEGTYGPADAPTMSLTGQPWAVYAWLTGRVDQASAGLHAEFNNTPIELLHLPWWA